jgi:SAM-dependent methyltransferase
VVQRFASALAPGRALDLACGAGRHAIYLAQLGLDVTAVDGSPAALSIVEERAAQTAGRVRTVVADLEEDGSVLEPAGFDLILDCYYLQRSLFPAIRAGTRPGGMVIAIVHIPAAGEQPNEKRAAPGELRSFFAAWRILHDYEGPTRDAAHRQPVAEIVASRLQKRPVC